MRLIPLLKKNEQMAQGQIQAAVLDYPLGIAVIFEIYGAELK